MLAGWFVLDDDDCLDDKRCLTQYLFWLPVCPELDSNSSLPAKPFFTVQAVEKIVESRVKIGDLVSYRGVF